LSLVEKNALVDRLLNTLTEWLGVAEVLLDDSVLATGQYHLVLEHPDEAGEPAAGPRARGTIRLDQGSGTHRAMSAPAVRIRLDHATELVAEVHLYVPGAGFVAFTCSDRCALQKLLDRRGEPH
jgi:hypothetical protein